MKKQEQKETAMKLIREALVARGVQLDENVPLKTYVNKEIRREVKQKLFDGVRAGQIQLSSEKDDANLRKYCSGLISHWLRKEALSLAKKLQS